MTLWVTPAQYQKSLETLAGFWTMHYTKAGIQPLDLLNVQVRT